MVKKTARCPLLPWSDSKNKHFTLFFFFFYTRFLLKWYTKRVEQSVLQTSKKDYVRPVKTNPVSIHLLFPLKSGFSFCTLEHTMSSEGHSGTSLDWCHKSQVLLFTFINDISIKYTQQQALGRCKVYPKVVNQSKSCHDSLVQEFLLMLFYGFLIYLVLKLYECRQNIYI